MKTIYRHLSCGVVATILLFTACTASRQEFVITSSLIPVDARWDKYPEPRMKEIVNKYKTSVDSIMNIEIGESGQYMTPDRPGSLLTNLTADILKSAAQSHFGQPVDFAICNTGGIRNPLLQGEITLGEIYSIFPFDNTLCLVKLSGTDLRTLFDIIVSRNGEAVSKEVRITGSNGKCTASTIDGKPLDDSRIYTIATIDYVANGGDHMTPFLQATERFNSNVFVRDVIIDYINGETRANRTVTALPENRIILTD